MNDLTKLTALQAAMDLDGRIVAAYIFSHAAHGAVGQKRPTLDNPDVPYIVHPIEVADIVARTRGVTAEQIMAALLHDTVEDTQTDIMVIRRLFGPLVALYVLQLTDVYTPENYPDLNRAARKTMECYRISTTFNAVKTIKLADGLSNTPSIAINKPKFMPTYGPEKRAAWHALRGGDPVLHAELNRELAKWGY